MDYERMSENELIEAFAELNGWTSEKASEYIRSPGPLTGRQAAIDRLREHAATEQAIEQMSVAVDRVLQAAG